MKELELLKERVQQAGRLIPWWANLILAEVSFVTLYLLESGLLWTVLISSFFIAACIVASFEAERREQAVRQQEAGEERMPVTKLIVKDLMKEKYRESFIKVLENPKQDCPERFSKTIFVSVAAVSMILSTAIIMRISGNLFEKNERLASSPVPQTALERYIPVPPQPMLAAKPEPQQAQFKTGPNGERILKYRVSMKDGRDLDCKNVDRTSREMFLFQCEHLSGAVHIARINDIEIRTLIPNGTRNTVVQPEDFSF
jgi:hypothetical protein